MFQRRAKHTTLDKVRQFFWPDMGLRRMGSYLLHRIGRLPGTPYSIAAGFACGAAASCTPLIGFHFILSIFLAWVMRANWVAAMIGTVVGNPWTFPFIYLVTYKVGTVLLGLEADGDVPNKLSLELLLNHPVEVLVPLMVGAVPAGIVMWLVTYWPLRWAVASYQARRAVRREKGLKRRFARRRFQREAVPGDHPG